MSAAPAKKRAADAAPKRGAARVPTQEPIDLDYNLAELPSAQHRAGLAGLVMTVDWLARHRGREQQGTCTITHRTAGGATLRIDPPGLKRLLDAIYDAGQEETASQSQWKDKRGEPREPLRIEERDVPDGKGGAGTKKKKFYIYPVVVPRGGCLIDYEPASADRSTPWLKLWRDMVWETLRGVPATRAPFEARAAKAPTTDHEDIWAELTDPKDRSVELPSTYYIGAQAFNAENVSFRDRARHQLLLHFWPFAAQIYVPSIMSSTEAKSEFFGYGLVIPDVADLEGLCAELPGVLQDRETALAAYRPRAAVIDLPAEGALDLARRLRARVAVREGGNPTKYFIVGAEVYHLRKEGNNVRLLGAARIEPEQRLIDEYIKLRDLGLWDHMFRRQRLQNLLDGRPWYAGFDRLIETRPQDKITIGSNAFRHDARISFETERKQREDLMQQVEDQQQAPDNLEDIVYTLMQAYVQQKLESKYGLKWCEKLKDEPKKLEEYYDKRRKLAKDAFLSVRSRTGAAFVDYFSGTLCSVKHILPKARYTALARALRDEQQRDDIRTLTLLALSAVS